MNPWSLAGSGSATLILNGGWMARPAIRTKKNPGAEPRGSPNLRSNVYQKSRVMRRRVWKAPSDDFVKQPTPAALQVATFVPRKLAFLLTL